MFTSTINISHFTESRRAKRGNGPPFSMCMLWFWSARCTVHIGCYAGVHAGSLRTCIYGNAVWPDAKKGRARGCWACFDVWFGRFVYVLDCLCIYLLHNLLMELLLFHLIIIYLFIDTLIDICIQIIHEFILVTFFFNLVY